MVMAAYKLKVEPMTEATFGPYGVLLDAKERPEDHRAFFPIDFQVDGKTTVNVIWQPQQGSRFSKLERHFGVTQSFVQISGAPAVVCAAAPTDLDDPQAIPEPDQIRAFLINPETGCVSPGHMAFVGSVSSRASGRHVSYFKYGAESNSNCGLSGQYECNLSRSRNAGQSGCSGFGETLWHNVRADLVEWRG